MLISNTGVKMSNGIGAETVTAHYAAARFALVEISSHCALNRSLKGLQLEAKSLCRSLKDFIVLFHEKCCM
uniref:Uncharacterized protein n=1 Tax=Romanomermis culicivorax TaxID=13658 RepID=A0A915JFN4_ROMCU